MKKLFCKRCGQSTPESNGEVYIFDCLIKKRIEPREGRVSPTADGEIVYSAELCDQCVDLIKDVIEKKVPA